MTVQQQHVTASPIAVPAPAPALAPAWPRGLPARLCRRGAALLNLQCWLWGQDIRRTEGNLLLQYGAARLRPPKHVTGCSQYSFALTPGVANGGKANIRNPNGSGDAHSAITLKLWGFGIYIGEPDRGCYLNRYEFVPRLASGEDCWNAAALRAASRNPPLHAVPAALRWIAAYERWILHTAGTAWRLAASAAGPDSTGTALTLATHWSTLARDIERWTHQRSLQPQRTPTRSAA